MLKFSISRQQYDALAYTGSCYWRRPNTRISLISRGLVESGTHKRTPLGDAVYQAVDKAAENEHRYPRNGIKVQIDETTIPKSVVEALPFTDGPDEPEGYDPTYDPAYEAYLEEQRVIRTAEFIRIGVLPEETTVTNPIVELRDRVIRVGLERGLVPPRKVDEPPFDQMEPVLHKVGPALSYMWSRVTDELTVSAISRRPMAGTATFFEDANNLLNYIESLDSCPVFVYGHKYDYDAVNDLQVWINREHRANGVILCEIYQDADDRAYWRWRYLRNGTWANSQNSYGDPQNLYGGDNRIIQAIVGLEDALLALV